MFYRATREDPTIKVRRGPFNQRAGDAGFQEMGEE
jgi:hypothetical protein